MFKSRQLSRMEASLNKHFCLTVYRENDHDLKTINFYLDIGRAILGQIGSMALTTGSALRLLVISCWLIAGSTGRSVNSLNNAVNFCEESDLMECIPKDFVKYIGLPMDRNQLAPT